MTEPRQLELPVTANTSFVYFFTGLCTSGKISELGMNAVGILLILKSFADWKTSKVSISHRRLRALSKLGRAGLGNALIRLEELGYIREEAKVRGRSCWTLFDILPTEDRLGEPSKDIQVRYSPLQMEQQRAEISKMLKNRNFTRDSKLGIQVFVVDNSSNTYNTYNTTNNFFGEITSVIEALAGGQLDLKTREKIINMAKRQREKEED